MKGNERKGKRGEKKKYGEKSKKAIGKVRAKAIWHWHISLCVIELFLHNEVGIGR
jgi:hypothetical protein